MAFFFYIFFQNTTHMDILSYHAMDDCGRNQLIVKTSMPCELTSPLRPSLGLQISLSNQKTIRTLMPRPSCSDYYEPSRPALLAQTTTRKDRDKTITPKSGSETTTPQELNNQSVNETSKGSSATAKQVVFLFTIRSCTPAHRTFRATPTKNSHPTCDKDCALILNHNFNEEFII